MTERWFEVLRETAVMIMPILLPVLLGLALLGMQGERSAKWVQGYVRASILLQVVLIGVVLGLTGSNASFLLFQLTSNLMIYFKIDAINRISTWRHDADFSLHRALHYLGWKRKKAGKAILRLLSDFLRYGDGTEFCRKSDHILFFLGMDERGLHSSCATQTDKGSLW